MPLMQTVLQPPQCSSSVCSSTQAPPHGKSGGSQMFTHVPLEQNMFVAQRVLQSPQWLGSACVSTHRPPQW